MELNLVFLGTPLFAVPTLERLVEAGHRVAAVVTQPDRPKGRGGKTAPTPVKEAALRLGLDVHQPERVRRPDVVDLLASIHADAMVVVGYGQIIPQTIIDLPRMGIFNVHASLLPKYRGAAPIQWAVANGEKRTGVTTMRIDAGLDTGDILLAWETEIGPEETAVELAERLAPAGAELMVRTLDGLVRGEIAPRRQNSSQATYAPILKKEDGLIDWNSPASAIHHRVRGLLPWPGCFTYFRGQLLHVWKARVAEQAVAGPPGRLRVAGRRAVAVCGDGRGLDLLEVQLEGRKRVAGDAFLHGYRLADDETLGEKPN